MILFPISQIHKRPGNQIVYFQQETAFQHHTQHALLRSELPGMLFGVYKTKAKGGALAWSTFPDCDGTEVPDSP